MPEDIYFDENFTTEVDEVGDVRTRTGAAAIRQAVATSVIEYRRRTTSGMSPTAIEDRRSAIEDAVRNNTFTEPPITVTVTDVDHETGTITYQVQTNRLNYPITL